MPVLEAAHIKPYAKGGEHDVANGLALRTDIHRLLGRRELLSRRARRCLSGPCVPTLSRSRSRSRSRCPPATCENAAMPFDHERLDVYQLALDLLVLVDDTWPTSSVAPRHRSC